jgi:dipeptidyl aminopeptidase/acylaminoacyl peptidase
VEPRREALRLIKRHTEMQNVMCHPGGIRVTEERELFQLRDALARYLAAVNAIMETASRNHRPLDTISIENVERLTFSPHLARLISLNRFRMRVFTTFLAIAWISVPAFAADSPTEDAAVLFGSRPDAYGMRLSPDGKNVAYIAPTSDRGSVLKILSLVAGSDPTVALAANGAPDRIQGCDWVANDRLVCRLHSIVPKLHTDDTLIPFWRIAAVNIDRSNLRLPATENSNWTLNIIDLLPDEDAKVLMTHSFVAWNRDEKSGLGVVRMDTRTEEMATVVSPAPNASNYLTDGKGVVRIMEQRDIGVNHPEGSVITYLFRDPDGEKWRKLSTYDRSDFSGFVPIAVDGKQNVAYGLKEQNGRRALYTRKLDGSNADELVYANDEVDVAGVYTIGRHRRVVGADYVTDYQHTECTDPDIRRLSETLRRAAGASATMRIVDSSLDESRYLLLSTADQNPGLYYVYDRDTHHLDSVMYSRAALEGVELAAAKPIKYPAKDGTQIPGYLTLPPGMTSGKGLPAIVMPHGGLSARDVWGFDWLAQYFAHQGYAVLQPNFRGSAGYGEGWFAENGFKSWQIAIGDVLDAGHWLVRQGIADPNKLGILGWSYGGYAALQSVVVDQGVFKAAVAIAPVTDLPALLATWRGSSAYALTRDFIGTGRHTHEGSPAEHADKIRVPVLLFHGKLDINVRYDQSKRMDQALTAAGVKHTFITFEGLDNQLEDSEKRAELLRESDAFFKAAFGS